MGGMLLELQRGVGEAAEGDGQPEVDGPVGEYAREGLPAGQPEPGEHGDQDELDHSQATRGDRHGGQDVGQSIGDEQVDRRDEVAEGGHEDPQRRGVEEPVGRRPADRLAQESTIVHEYGEPLGQALDQRGEPVGVEEADVGGHGPDDPAGPLLTAGQQVEQPPEGAEQHHTDGGRDHEEDRRRGGGVPVEPGRRVEPVQDEEGHQRQPEHHIQYHRRTDALGAEGEAGVGAGHPGLGEQPVAQGGPRCGPSGRDVAECEGRQVDPEQAEPGRPTVGEYRVGELCVGRQGGDLQEDAEGQVGHVDVCERADLAAVARHQRQRHVEEEEEDEHGADADPHFTAHEWTPVPPPCPPSGRRRFALRHLCRLDLHHPHVVTTRRPDLPC